MQKTQAVNDPNASRTLITAGEVFHDLIFFDLQHLPAMGEELKTDSFTVTVGGGAAITAAAAARLGRRSRMITVWGDTPLDAEARSRLNDMGLDLELCRIQPGQRSGLTVAVSTRQDRYFLTAPGANRLVVPYLLEADALAGVEEGDHVHFALTPTRWEPFEKLISQLRQRSVTSSWDLGWDPQAASQPSFARLRSSLDILFLNQMEALRYTETKDVDEAIKRLTAEGKTVVLKLGRKGAMAGRGPEREQAAPVAVKAIETTGAGDAFNGGFLHRWMEGAPLGDCLEAGNVCGALSTRRPGGLEALPSGQEFEEHMN